MATRTKSVPTEEQYAGAAALREALRAFQRQTELVTAKHGITPRVYVLLLVVKTGRAATGRASLHELEERLRLGKSTITELVQRAEERGLIRRELDPVRRGAILVRLTAAGERKLARTCFELGDERRRLVGLLSDVALD